MKFFPDPWSKETPWGLTLDAAASLQPFLKRLREHGELNAEVLDRPGIAECINRGLLNVRRESGEPVHGMLPTSERTEPNSGDWVVSVTERGRAVIDGLQAMAAGRPIEMARFWATFPDDGRSYDERLQRLLDLQARKRELVPEIIEARKMLIPVLAAEARKQVQA